MEYNSSLPRPEAVRTWVGRIWVEGHEGVELARVQVAVRHRGRVLRLHGGQHHGEGVYIPNTDVVQKEESKLRGR